MKKVEKRLVKKNELGLVFLSDRKGAPVFIWIIGTEIVGIHSGAFEGYNGRHLWYCVNLPSRWFELRRCWKG